MKGLNVLLLIALLLVLLAIEDTESKKMTIEEAKKTLKNMRKSCSKKTDAPKELLDGQHRGEFPPDERLMCYMKCIMISSKAMKNDQIQWDFFIKNTKILLLDEYLPRVEHIVEVCKKEVTATESCEVAWQFGKCIYATDPEVIFKNDFIENDTLALRNPVKNTLMADSRDHRRSRRNIESHARRHLRRRRRRRSRRKAATAVCRNSRTKPQCRRV
ncbi:PREDICTED: uncharacterized protein LOC108554789 [Eufriesea mexicana]|uniref:uncharacterized protein LOC108554789 n=1 Tax=Eufriesea mexicana TaxID=516756 RepID=UPI00083C4F72|nr:PREDICTED: uncharacterized protein LOC108554789 [Eufriesea mexicana]